MLYIYIYIYLYIYINIHIGINRYFINNINILYNSFNVIYLFLRIFIYILYSIIYKNCLCGSVAKASDTQAVGHGFEPRPDH